MIVAAFLIFVLLFIFILRSIKKPHNFPPGPSWAPILGNLLYLKKLSKALGGQHLALLELSKQFKTNVLGLKLGNMLVVTVFSFPLVKAVLTAEEYEGRPDNFFSQLRSFGTRKGLTFTDGEFWVVQRNFVVRHLRNLGFGKKIMEEKIKEEIKDVVDTIKSNGEEVRIERLLAHAVFSVMWFLIAGIRIPRNDPRFNKLLDILSRRTKALDISGGILGQQPWLRFVAPEKTGYNLIKNLNVELREFFMKPINEHYEKWTEERDDDLIYAFISEMMRTNGQPTTFSIDQLLMVCVDLFIAGSQTTSNTLDFAFLMMLLHPDVQAKAQIILDQTFDRNRELDYDDRYKVPYVEAVLLEAERYCGVVPILGPRRVLKDTVLEGYNIPKNFVPLEVENEPLCVVVMIHTYSVHKDPNIWGDPEVFRPERFLNSEGKLISQETVLPFGLGRRRCLGEPLARNCIFIFFAEILRSYTIAPIAGAELPSDKPVFGASLAPQRYSARYIRRNGIETKVLI